MTAPRLRTALLAAGVLALAGLAACDTQEDLSIGADGSGFYSARVSVEPNYRQQLVDLETRALAAGFTVETRGDTGDKLFLVLAKRFDDPSELSHEGMTVSWSTRDVRSTKRNYSLRIELPATPKSPVRRILRVELPGKVISSGAGRSDGGAVEWDATRGGTLMVVTSGFVVPLTPVQKILAGVGLLALVAGVAYLRRRLRPKPRRCDSCGGEMAEDQLLCHLCAEGAGKIGHSGAA